MSNIAILGAGAFGTALAISLARDGRNIALWSRNPEHAAAMARDRQNAKRLPDMSFPKSLHVTSDLDSIKGISTLLVAVPMQKLNAFAHDHGSFLDGKALVACSKGVDLTKGVGPTELLMQATNPTSCSILTGPSFARDIASGLPTALTLAVANPKVGIRLQSKLTTANIRIYRTTDVIGAELGGALKNVMAIACGAAIGAGLGESARAALVTRGFAEMQRMAHALGAKVETLSGLSGFGDLVLTCTSEQSRNYQYGKSLGQGEAFDPLVTVEGVATANACLARASELGLDMPITAAVVALSQGRLNVKEAMDALLARDLKEE